MLGAAACITVSLRIDFYLLVSYVVAMSPAFAAVGLPLVFLFGGLLIGSIVLGCRNMFTGVERTAWVIILSNSALLLFHGLILIPELLSVLVLDGVLTVSPVVMAVPLYVAQAPLLIYAIGMVIVGCTKQY